jgi:hypothetical protein
VKNDSPDGNSHDEEVRPPRFGLGRILVVVFLVWVGVTAVTWAIDLAHRVFVLAVVGVVVFAVARVARKS